MNTNNNIKCEEKKILIKDNFDTQFAIEYYRFEILGWEGEFNRVDLILHKKNKIKNMRQVFWNIF